MSETYYIRLPLYLTPNPELEPLNGTEKRTVEINLSDDFIDIVEVTAINNSSANIFTFSVTKDPGTYLLKLTPYKNENGMISICLDDVWVSNDNVNYYSVLLNYNEIVKSPDFFHYGFDPSKGAILWSDTEFTVQISLLDNINWNKLYNKKSLSDFKNDVDRLISEGKDPYRIEMAQTAYDYFVARGYN